MTTLQEKTLFITGGTGFIGSAICRLAHAYGAKIIFSYRQNREAAEKLLAELPGSRAIEMDLRHVADIQKKIEVLYAEINRIDVLVNNAAISQVMPLPLIEEEDVDWIMDVNIKGTLFVTKQVIKGMIRNKTGAIVNIGSIAGSRILDVPITYAMTKSAIRGLTYALAAEIKRFHIRVNAVELGLMEGGVGKGVPETLKQDFMDHCTVGRAGKASEAAEAVCFLASDQSGYINGQIMAVDGGI